MRRMAMTLVGASAAGSAWAASSLLDGLPGAAAFMLAIFVGTVTLGLLAAAVVDRLSAPPRRIDRVTDHISQLLMIRDGADPSRPCRSCGAGMFPVGSVWVCGTCDLAGIGA